MSPLISKRYYIVLILLGLGFVVIGSRLFFLGLHKDNFKSFIETARQRVRILPASRGQIIDCKGRCLATQQKVYDLGVDLTQIQENDKTYLPQLSYLLSINLKSLEKIWHKSTCRWKSLQNNVPESTYKKIQQLHIRGVYGNEKQQRIYMHAPSLSYIVGFLNREGTPVSGIEKMMQFYLNGQSGYLAYEVNGKNNELVQYRKNKIKPIDGYTVELTIDNYIQTITENIAKISFEKFTPQSIQILISRPHTGEILSLVNYPFFDSNHYNQYSIDQLTNKAVTNIYEPGSVFKPITVCAALDTGSITPNDKFNCGLSKANYNGKELPLPHDWKTFNQEMSVGEILANSSNKGTVQIAFKLGAKKLYTYGKLFGFGSSTKSHLEGETNGIFHPINQWDGLTITRLPIGHSLACSLFQMHYAMGVIANGGTLLYPQLIRRIYKPNGDIVRTFEPKIRRRVIKEETSEIMRKMLLLSDHSKAYIHNYNVTGKTGTTQKIIHGHYSHNQHIASFSGFFPNKNPQIQITITVDSPHIAGTGYGSVVAAPIFKEIAEQIIPYLKIEPESKPL